MISHSNISLLPIQALLDCWSHFSLGTSSHYKPTINYNFCLNKLLIFCLLKGYFTQKFKCCHHLLTLMSFQTQKNIFWRTKQLLVPIDFHSRERNTMEVDQDHQLFDYQHSTKYLILCSTYSLGWTIPLTVRKVHVKFRYVAWLRDLKYGHSEYGIIMCFIRTNKWSIC